MDELVGYRRGKPPCYDCGLRFPGCHGKCAEYNAWKTAYKSKADRIREEKERATADFRSDTTQKLYNERSK